MHRFFVPPESLNGETVSLPAEVLHHLAVLRLKPGEEVLLLDGLGKVCRSRIDALGRRSGQAVVLERWLEEESAFPVHLLQSLPKGDKMDLVLQKGTELGITAFTPLLTGRTISLPDAEREEKRLHRWRRIVREAGRQCRRPVLPHLAAPLPLAEGLSSCREELRLMLWEEESRPLAEVLPPAPPRDAAVLVGPEGGFDSREAEEARRAGFLPVRIGPRILRSETAGFAVAALLQYLYGDLGVASPAHRERIPS
ncbi:MAG: 16S rRNA (uracil(1498)-N(3))-methyltransferase [Desulfuromonadales bacterium]